MTVTADIRAALEGQIANVTGIPSSANRAWENVEFTPDTGTSWVRMTLAPGEQRPAVRGPSPQILHEGIFLVDVFVPTGNGPNAAEALADAIRDQFTVDDVYTSNGANVRFRWSERGQGIVDEPWYLVPVTVSWYSYRSS